eukprot:6096108-Prymnesium_polylepis.1
MRVVESRTAWRRRTEARVADLAVIWSYALRSPMTAAVAGGWRRDPGKRGSKWATSGRWLACVLVPSVFLLGVYGMGVNDTLRQLQQKSGSRARRG